MKLKLMFLSLISFNIPAGNSSSSQSEKIKLPKADILKIQIESVTDFEFANRTTIVQRLAGKTLTAHAIAIEIEKSVDEYRDSIKKLTKSRFIEQNLILATSDLYNIYTLIFRDHPEWLPELKKLGFKHAVRPEFIIEPSTDTDSE